MQQAIADIRLDSSLAEEANGWSQSVGPASKLLWCDAATLVANMRDERGEIRRWEDPIDALRWMEASGREAGGRWVGYLSYDLGRLFERLPIRARDDLSCPLFVFTWHRDGAKRSVLNCEFQSGASTPSRWTFTRASYVRAVARTIEYIAAGDVFQVNLSQRFSVPVKESAREIYERLRERSPAAYGALLDYGSMALVCNSPELFLRVSPNGDGSRRVTTRPIKGTRASGVGRREELRDSVKDQAELNMIVDLERNDLGRVCEIGSVKVTQPRAIEEHPTVYHGVATIEGKLRSDVGLVELLRATFPGGSITGAPKIRAMEIIEELEPVRRGPYCGAIGYISCDGHMEFNVAIRTMIVKDGLVHIPVGGGIVADSKPEEEYEETLVKAEAMMRAVGISRSDIAE